MAEMTSKERILNALTGKEIDRVPWSPFLAYYWDFLSPSEQSCGQAEYLKKMGADPLLRGFYKPFSVEFQNCEYTTKQDGDKTYHTFTTKVGSLSAISVYSSSAKTGYTFKHPVSTEEDFKTLQYIMENVIVHETPTEFLKASAELGDNGLIAPSIGIHGKTAFQGLLERWCGTEALIYALCDFPEVVEECLAVMWEKDMETLRCSLNTSVDLFNFFENSSTTNINPEIYAKYTAPMINKWGKMIHAEGKLLMQHSCGHLKNLLPLISQTEIDVLESVSPPPTGNIEIEDVARQLPEHIAVIGGLEPTFFESCSLDELEKRVQFLLSTMQGKRYVLANSDSCPPGVSYDKFLLVSELVRK